MTVSRILAPLCLGAALAASISASAQAGKWVVAPKPYINACTLAASRAVDVPWNAVRPGPVFATHTGLRVQVLAAGQIAMTCRVAASMRIESLTFD